MTTRFSQRGMASGGEKGTLDQKIERANIAYGRHLSISVTQRCPLRCSHCIVSCLPSNDISLDIPDAAVQSILDSLPKLSESIKQISFTGGEPFLCKDVMCRISHDAYKHSISCGAVTSAHWATSLEKARKTLEEIPHLDHITISYDKYHSEYIKLSSVRHAVEAAEALGKTASIRASIPPNAEESHMNFLNALKFEFEDRVHTQEVLSFGRASDLNIKANYSNSAPILPCLSSGPHVTESGNVIPCCSTLDNKIPISHPLNLGDVSKIPLVNVYQQSNHNVLLNFIRLWGFPQIMEVLSKELPEKYSGMRFVEEGQCSLCATLMHDKETVEFLENWTKDIDIHLKTAAGVATHFGKTEVLSKVVDERKKEIEEYSG
ncbi:radical SAM protein [uncultured Pseudoteredinibacter sp.]|uniref:radical SAM protein n=1 Tax=uncultured Pseudoteredinibacter sp. TaxID=1641701 RepID=UPI0026359EAC|nr:radical SAM protein [uncultured Pseudoteredinibacter sp.]